jgi:ribosomal protein L16 Arg81 hydroxylase
MYSLAQLLHPYNLEDFLQHHWDRRAIAISAKGERRFDTLFSWQTLNHLLNFHEFHYPDLRLALEGQVLDERANEKLIHWLQQGATLIIDRIHQWHPTLATVTAALRHDLGYATQLNAYCSFPHKQGFSCHYDTHEVFILQIDGRKEWRVFMDTFKHPLVDQKSSSLTPPDEPPYLSCVLQPGDVLYIPRGHWHYALALDEPSLHLTLGIHVKTGINWLEWLVEQCRQQEVWRRSLPLQLQADERDKQIHQLIQNLSQVLENPNLSQEYAQHLAALGKPIAKYHLPQQAGFTIFPQGKTTQFRLHPFQQVQISELPDGTGYCITTAGKEIALRGVPSSAVEALFNQECFSGEDVQMWLSDFDWEIEIAPVLSRLVMEGILMVEVGG